MKPQSTRNKHGKFVFNYDVWKNSKFRGNKRLIKFDYIKMKSST